MPPKLQGPKPPVGVHQITTIRNLFLVTFGVRQLADGGKI